MTSAEFNREFTRLAAHFHLPPDEGGTLTADWFAALKHYHVEALDHAVTELTRTATDRYWPALGRVLELIKARLNRYDRPSGKCNTCHGSSWVDAPPWKSNGIVYEGLQRCPDCGVPALKEVSHGRRAPLTDLEAHEYQQGRYGRELMPLGMTAKHPEKVGNPEFKAWAERLNVKLFGVAEEAS